MSEYSVYVNDNGTPKLVTVGDLEKLISAAKEQAFTDEEKALARKNIGALGNGEVDLSGLVKTINNNAPDALGNITPNQTGCLPLTGGSLTGILSLMNGNILRILGTDSSLVRLNNVSSNGFFIENYDDKENVFSRLVLRKKDHPTRAGFFELDADDGVTSYSLVGKPSKELTWAGSVVYTAGTGVPVGNVSGLRIGATTMTRSATVAGYNVTMSVSRDNYGRLTGTSLSANCNCNCNCDCNCDCADSDSDGG